jgi:hypothetical protein
MFNNTAIWQHPKIGSSPTPRTICDSFTTCTMSRSILALEEEEIVKNMCMNRCSDANEWLYHLLETLSHQASLWFLSRFGLYGRHEGRKSTELLFFYFFVNSGDTLIRESLCERLQLYCVSFHVFGPDAIFQQAHKMCCYLNKIPFLRRHYFLGWNSISFVKHYLWIWLVLSWLRDVIKSQMLPILQLTISTDQKANIVV